MAYWGGTILLNVITQIFDILFEEADSCKIHVCVKMTTYYREFLSTVRYLFENSKDIVKE